MSDERLRDLERRWRTSRSAAAEAAWLIARARSGDALDGASYARLVALDVQAAAAYTSGRVEQGELALESLALLAHCGEPAAALVAGPSHTGRDLSAWIEGLPSFRGWPVYEAATEGTYPLGEELEERGLWDRAYARGKEIEARAGVAIARLVLPESRFLVGSPPEGYLHAEDALEAIEAIESWIVTPDARTAESAQSAGSNARFAAEFAVYPHTICILGGFAATFCAGEIGNIPDPGPTTSSLLDATRLALDALRESSARGDPQQRVRDAVRDELIPWALGTRDLVRERVEARERGSAG